MNQRTSTTTPTAFMVRTATICSALVVCLLLVLVATAPSSVSAASPATGPALHSNNFRCFRPFSRLQSFTPKHMHHKDNCNFGYLQVHHADLAVNCHSAAALNESAGGCTATVSLKASAIKGRAGVSVENARFYLELHADGQSTIKYKGFDGRGFSTCCDMGSKDLVDCEWEGKVQRVDKCPLATTVERGGFMNEADTFNMTITKPLHTLSHGRWEAKVTFFRDVPESDNIFGRLVVSTDVAEETIAVTRGGEDHDLPAAVVSTTVGGDGKEALVAVDAAKDGVNNAGGAEGEAL